MRALAFIVVATCVLAGLPAQAYVQTRTSSGTAVHWEQSCIVVQPDARGDQSGDAIDVPTINTTLATAVANWNGADGKCTFLRLGVIDAYQELDAVSDGTPAVVFDTTVWGRGDVTYDPMIIGLTTVWFANRPNDPTDGLISDADIELNAVNYTFTTDAQSTTPRSGTLGIADLQNTLTHELGHVQGLAHTCWDHANNDADPVDNDGNLIPDCNSASLPAVVTGATMYPYAAATYPADISMRTLSPDDISGICDNYPSTGVATACYGYVETKGCSMPPRLPPTRWPAAVALIPVLWIVTRRR